MNLAALLLAFVFWILLQFTVFYRLLSSPGDQRQLTYFSLGSKFSLTGSHEPPSKFGFHSLHCDQGGKEIPLKIPTQDGLHLEAWHVTSKDSVPAKEISGENPLFIFLHGKGANRTRSQKRLIYGQLLKAFPASQVLTIDYRGFAGSPGSPTQEGVTMDARAAWDYATSHLGIPAKHIVIVGQSLGAAIATYLLKSINQDGIKPRATFLLCGFKSVPELAITFPTTRVLLPLVAAVLPSGEYIEPYIKDKWDAQKAVLAGLDGPLLYLHGTWDGVVPYYHAKGLVDSALQARNVGKDELAWELDVPNLNMKVWPKNVGFITIPSGGHDDMGNRPEIFSALREFLERCTESD